MWAILFAATAMAQEPVGEVAPPALEAAFTLTMPAGGLGVGPGVRLGGDAGLKGPVGLRLGGELDLRLPSGDEGTIEDPAVVGGLDYHARMTVLGLGGTVSYHFGPADGVRGRIGTGLGLGFLFQGTEGPAGTSTERATTLWLRPQGGVLIPAGPGDVTASLLIAITPVELQVVDPASVSLALAAGYRVGF